MIRFSRPVRIRVNGRLSERYYVRVNEGTRRTWKCTGASSLKAAEAVVESWRVKAAQGQALEVREVSFEEASDKWIEEKRSEVSPRTWKEYRLYAEGWKRVFGRRPLGGITRDDVREALEARRLQGISAVSLNNERRQLALFFNWAVALGLARTNPVRHTKPYRVSPRPIRVLDDAEEERLLAEARLAGGNLYPWLLCAVTTGFRRSTISALEWSDVDLTRREWRVDAAKLKSRRPFTGRPIAPELLSWLRENYRPAGLIFGPLDLPRFRAAAKRAGVSWLRPHDLRRSFVSKCRRRGVPLEVCLFLGDWTDPGVVLSVYSGVTPAQVREAAQRVFGGDRAQAQTERAG